jgi:hypothetical protein
MKSMSSKFILIEQAINNRLCIEIRKKNKEKKDGYEKTNITEQNLHEKSKR